MNKLDFKNLKLELEYPCEWTYKVIGTGKELLQKAVTDVINEKKCEIALSNTSSKGKYCCLNLDMRVENEGERTMIFQLLKNHPNIKMVL